MPEFLWKWRREIIFTLLMLLSLGMLVSEREPGLITQTLRQGVSFIVVPFQKISMQLVKSSQRFFLQTVSAKKMRAQNAELKRKVEKLSLRNTLLLEQVRENEILREELGYKKRTLYTFLPAEIIARDPASWLSRAVLDRGSSDDVRPGRGVITPYGVVGRILEVNMYSATVMLLLDTESSVAGVVERSHIHGTVKGTGQKLLHMMYVSSEDDVKKGDTVVTSALSTLFPPGIPIGDVIQVAPSENDLMLDIQIKPRVDFKSLDRFLILMKED
ncbi:rod shape-determining protein MreC [candidate division FCPU426 bacterium]|nr:rod shape-determining protein MreC [candidate division FCPU426 bacterium]